MKERRKKQKLFVKLGSVIDKSQFYQYSSSMQFEELSRPKENKYYEVNSLKEASKVCREYIKLHNLGSSNWIGGRVIDENTNFVAMVSYNGRVWNSEEHPCKEIEI